MNDQGEKIIFLAREMLAADMNAISAEPQRRPVAFGFKTLCLTTFLAASGGAAATYVTHETCRPLNHYEKTEIDALVFYAAKTKKINEDALRHDVERHIGIARLEDMTSNQFPAARRYLQDAAQ